MAITQTNQIVETAPIRKEIVDILLQGAVPTNTPTIGSKKARNKEIINHLRHQIANLETPITTEED